MGKKFETEWCSVCQADYIECPKCGNNTCNGGHGEIKGKECDICSLAHQYDKQSQKYAGLVEAAEKIVIQVNRLENLATVQNPQIAKFLYDANNNLKAALGRVKG